MKRKHAERAIHTEIQVKSSKSSSPVVSTVNSLLSTQLENFRWSFCQLDFVGSSVDALFFQSLGRHIPFNSFYRFVLRFQRDDKNTHFVIATAIPANNVPYAFSGGKLENTQYSNLLHNFSLIRFFFRFCFFMKFLTPLQRHWTIFSC